MPFTPAHVAAVLPLLGSERMRRVLDPTALVLGAMAPDFDYFLHGRMQGSISHTLPGLLLFDVPVTLVLWCAWRFICARPVQLSLPSFVARRTRWTRHDSISAHALLLGALVGSATHLLWDAFTHGTSPVVAQIPALHEVVELPVLGRMVAYRALQHLSSVVGLLALAGWGIHRLRRAPPREVVSIDDPGVRYVLPACCIAGSIIGASLGCVLHGLSLHTLAHLVVLTIDGWLLGLLVGALVVGGLASRAASPADDDW